MGAMVRGSLPPEIYWRRRLLLLAIALVLVFGLSRVLGGGSDGSDGNGRVAAQTGAQASVTPGAAGATSGTPGAGPTAGTSGKPLTKKQQKAQEKAAKKAAKQAAADAVASASAAAASASAAALPDPQGPCGDTDVVVTPTIPSPVAGSDVTIELALSTRFSPACSWRVSPDSLALKITSGPDNIWSTQQCPKAVPTQDLILRRAIPTTVQIVWSSKRSDQNCSARTDYAFPGFYHVLVAALAGEPTDLQFELTQPVAGVVTKTAEPQAGTPGTTGRAGKSKTKKSGQ